MHWCVLNCNGPKKKIKVAFETVCGCENEIDINWALNTIPFIAFIRFDIHKFRIQSIFTQVRIFENLSIVDLSW